MCIDTCIPGSASQRLIVFVRNVLACFWVSISFGKAEIDDINNILFLAVADQEVVRFHVPVDEMVIVQKLKPLNHLVGNHQSCLNREFPFAEIEGVLETWPEQIHDHCVVVAFNSEPMDSRNSSC